MSPRLTRRALLRMTASGAFLGTLGSFGRALAATSDTSGYKALVCLFLAGGNDGFNWLVPTTPAGYATYSKSRSNLALASSSLLPLNGTASDGYRYGMHAACPELQALFNAGSAALLGNVGTLIAPVTATQARAGSAALPPQLFSHSDQQTAWMTSIPNTQDRYGWGGRIADLLTAQQGDARLAYNLTLGGANYFQDGRNSIPYVLGTNGAPTLNVLHNPYYMSGLRQQAARDLIDQAAANPHLLMAARARVLQNSEAKVGMVNDAFEAAGDISTSFPSFPSDSYLSGQLRQVARTIKARAQIGDSRQIFFVQMGGFDTHNGQLATQQSLLQALSQDIAAFWSALGEIGARDQVTLFTASDFGRSLGSNGDGADHAWGNHHLVLGGAVKGGKFYGRMPSLAIDGADDIGNGRIVPTTSTDQYAATLARWFGVSDSDLDSVFPNLRNFSQRNLGFLA